MTEICSVTDVLLECHMRHGVVRNSVQKDTAQESQRDTLKVPPFYFIPEGTSVPDTEEIQDSKGKFHKSASTGDSISLASRGSLLPALLHLGESFGVV